MKSLFTLAIFSVFSLSADAAVRTWDGGGADANWQTPANWVNDTAPVANDDLVFPSVAAQLATNNNFFIQTNFNSVTIDGSYTVGGNPFRIGAGGLIVNSGTVAVNTSITTSAATTFTSGVGATATIVFLSIGNFGPIEALRIDGAGSFGIGLISGSGGLRKLGDGASLIAGSGGYNGQISVDGGILVIDANLPGNVILQAPAGGVGGTGTIGSLTALSGGVSAGTLTSPTGIFNTGAMSLWSGSAYICKLGGPTPGAGGHDQINVTGTVNIDNARLAPLPWNGFRPAIGETLVILRNDGTDAVSGNFLNAPEGAVFAGPLNTSFRISYVGGDGNDIAVRRVPRASFDFDADGKSDLSAFTGDGWVYEWSSIGQTFSNTLGIPASDVIVPADYDGDSRTDVAIYRPSQGAWYTISSTTTTLQIRNFGSAEDLPIPNDFDGDGRADLAIFRPSTGDWWIQRSITGQTSAQHFGTMGDKPLMADFDGDGIGDLAVFRPTGGEWYFLRSSDGSYSAFPFGIATDSPVPADYDGDGKTDPAVFRPTQDGSEPDFYLIRSSDGAAQYVSWGLPGDRPVVADYDGDGKVDVAIERPGAGFATWYMLQTTGGFQFRGFPNSIRPVPAAYVR